MSLEICFSPWASWASRTSLPDKDKTGLYLLARFEEKLSLGPANYLEKSIVYIGQTSKQAFKKRLRAFGNAAFENKGKNRAGKRYKEQFGGDSSLLYISTLPEEELMKAFLSSRTYPSLGIDKSHINVDITAEFLSEIDDLLVKYLERKLILLYSLAHGQRPACNQD